MTVFDQKNIKIFIKHEASTLAHDSYSYLNLFRDNKEESTEDNIDEILKQHHDMQEKVAEEMILMTQSMKQTSLRSRDIIKKDKAVNLCISL